MYLVSNHYKRSSTQPIGKQMNYPAGKLHFFCICSEHRSIMKLRNTDLRQFLTMSVKFRSLDSSLTALPIIYQTGKKFTLMYGVLKIFLYHKKSELKYLLFSKTEVKVVRLTELLVLCSFHKEIAAVEH